MVKAAIADNYKIGGYPMWNFTCLGPANTIDTLVVLSEKSHSPLYGDFGRDNLEKFHPAGKITRPCLINMDYIFTQDQV